tara:strand:+ start:1795 stop:2583 length:789 start_codon:yes stop_codon:yes gene_type:complete
MMTAVVGSNYTGIVVNSINDYSLRLNDNSFQQNKVNSNIDRYKISNENQLPDSIQQQFLDLYKNRGKSETISNPSNKPTGVLNKKEKKISDPPKEKKILLGDFKYSELEIDGSNTEEILSYCKDYDGMMGLCAWWKVAIRDWLYAKNKGLRKGGKFALGTISNIHETANSQESLTMALICNSENPKYYATGHAIITKGLTLKVQNAQMPLGDAYSRSGTNVSNDFVKKSKNYLFNKLTEQAGCPLNTWDPNRKSPIKSWLEL